MPIRELFGGAIQAEIPEAFDDISNFRQVPDNQEVFADAKTDRSLIVEVLDTADVEDEKCGEFFFKDLAECSNATRYQILHEGPMDSSTMPNVESNSNLGKFVCFGHQWVSKFREGSGAENLVDIYMCILRSKQVQADILVTFNAPRSFSSSSSSSSCSLIEATENYKQLVEMLRHFRIKNIEVFRGS